MIANDGFSFWNSGHLDNAALKAVLAQHLLLKKISKRAKESYRLHPTCS